MALTIDFAFEGFRVIREKPRLILIWGLARLVLAGLFGAAAWYGVKTYAPQIQQVFTSIQTKDPQVMLGILGTFIVVYLGVIAVALVIGAIFNCALFRAAYRAPNEGLGYLRFGGDEWRQVGLSLLLFLLVLGIYLAVIIVFVVLAGVAGVAGGKSGGALAGVVMVLLAIALLIGLFWVMVRMSLCMVQTFDTRRINVFGSWALTKGNFWMLFGGYLVAGVMAILVSLLASIIITVIVGLATGDMMQSAMTTFGTPGATPAQDINAMLAMFTTPRFLLSTALQELIAAPLIMAVMGAPAVAAYRVLSGQTAASVDKVF